MVLLNCGATRYHIGRGPCSTSGSAGLAYLSAPIVALTPRHSLCSATGIECAYSRAETEAGMPSVRPGVHCAHPTTSTGPCARSGGIMLPKSMTQRVGLEVLNIYSLLLGAGADGLKYPSDTPLFLSVGPTEWPINLTGKIFTNHYANFDSAIAINCHISISTILNFDPIIDYNADIPPRTIHGRF